jgi:hypothetical protein
VLITFCKGSLRIRGRGDRTGTWAETPFGVLWLDDDPAAEVECVSPERTLGRAEVTRVDLCTDDRETAETLAREILRRRLLLKPGIAGKGEAVLYVLVNEAIHEMERIAAKESRDS